MFCFCTTFCEVSVFHDVWAFALLIFFKGETKSPQFFNQLFRSVLHEKLNDWKMTRNSASSFFYMICLLSVDSVNAHLMANSVLAQSCIWVHHNIADYSVDGSYHFGLQDWNGLLAQVQHWRDVISGWVNQSPLPTLHPPSSPKGRGAICVL